MASALRQPRVAAGGVTVAISRDVARFRHEGSRSTRFPDVGTTYWPALRLRIARNPISGDGTDPDLPADLQRHGGAEELLVGRIADDLLRRPGLGIDSRHDRRGVGTDLHQALDDGRPIGPAVAGRKQRPVRLEADVVGLEVHVDEFLDDRRLTARQLEDLPRRPVIDVEPSAVRRRLDPQGDLIGQGTWIGGLEHGADRRGGIGPFEGAEAKARDVAYRAGGDFTWDAANIKPSGNENVDKYIRPVFREGWKV